MNFLRFWKPPLPLLFALPCSRVPSQNDQWLGTQEWTGSNDPCSRVESAAYLAQVGHWTSVVSVGNWYRNQWGIEIIVLTCWILCRHENICIADKILFRRHEQLSLLSQCTFNSFSACKSTDPCLQSPWISLKSTRSQSDVTWVKSEAANTICPVLSFKA